MVFASPLSGRGGRGRLLPVVHPSQSFWQATDMDPENITGASGYALVSTTDAGATTTQSCFLDALAPGQADYEAMLELLEGTTYRASLQNLLPPSSSHAADSVTATAAFALGDRLVTLQAAAPGTVLVTPSSGRAPGSFRLPRGPEPDPGRLCAAAGHLGKFLAFSLFFQNSLLFLKSIIQNGVDFHG